MDTQSRLTARSCTTCAKAKARCVRNAEQDICVRCDRLKKDCYMREPAIRKKKGLPKATRAAQLEKLESKIESLVNALSGSQTQPQPQQPDQGHLSPPTSHTSPTERTESRSTEILNSLCPHRDESLRIRTGSVNAPHGASLPAAAPTEPTKGITLSEAEILLDRYQRLMAPGFPFVVISSGTTARTLYERKPVLLQAITTVTLFHDLPRQETLVNDFIREIAERIMIKNQKSVDVLQGIIVFMSWYYPHVFWSSQATNLLHLAIAQTVDLGIDRPPQLCPDFKSVTARAVHGPSLIGRVPNLDEHRALLGVFFLCSMLSCSLKKLDPVPPTKYMEECAGNLLQAGEYESDTTLVQLFRMQAISHNVHTNNGLSSTTSVYTRAFIADLERVRKSNPCKEENMLLQLQDLAVETSIWALSLNELQENRSKPLNLYLDSLCRCMASAKSFMDNLFSVPTSTYLLQPFSVYGYFALVLITMIKLASLEVDGWDVKTAIREIGFLDICDGAADRFEEVSRTRPDGLTINNGAFSKWGGKVRWMKQVYLAKFAHEAGAGGNFSMAANVEGPASRNGNFATTETRFNQLTPPDDMMSYDIFNMMDETFWDFDFSCIEQPGVD